jgi:hypothetical protein
MTLVFSVHSRDCLWVVVDRRLSYGARRAPVDDAVKIMNLETLDGCGVLAYAGLGATPRGTQPSQWMSAVLRGRGGMTFEQTLGALTDAATRELPKYLPSVPGGSHSIVVPAFVRGIGSRLYTIDNVVDRKTGQHWYRYTSHQRTAEPGSPSRRLAAAGTGGLYIARKGRDWQRALMSLVNEYDRGKTSDRLIADRLAQLNYEVHEALEAPGTGPLDHGPSSSGADGQTLGLGGREGDTSSIRVSIVIGTVLRSRRSLTEWTCRQSPGLS